MRNAMSYVTQRYSLLDAVQDRVSEHLSDAFGDEHSELAGLDHWTRQRLIDENLAKVSLVFEAENPIEVCYHDLIREIDIEAETGIYHARPDARQEYLRNVVEESGVSGELCGEDKRMAHERAHLAACVSEIAMTFLMDDAEPVKDMSDVLRAFFYTIHEDNDRRQRQLPALLGELERRDLQTMVTELRREADVQK
jgi:hypothetical protein